MNLCAASPIIYRRCMSIWAASFHMKHCLLCQLPYLRLFSSGLVEILHLSNFKISAVEIPRTVNWLYLTPLSLMIFFLLRHCCWFVEQMYIKICWTTEVLRGANQFFCQVFVVQIYQIVTGDRVFRSFWLFAVFIFHFFALNQLLYAINSSTLPWGTSTIVIQPAG